MEMQQIIVILTAVASVMALLFALFKAKGVLKFDEGTEAMKKISLSVRKCANAYIKSQ